MRRAAQLQQKFGAVISERAPESKDLVATQELEKFLQAMGLYENDEGSKRRKVSSTFTLALTSKPTVLCSACASDLPMRL